MASLTAPIDMAAAPAWRLIVTGATLRYVWRIPLLVGTLLTLVNQGTRLTGGFDAAVILPVRGSCRMRSDSAQLNGS